MDWTSTYGGNNCVHDLYIGVKVLMEAFGDLPRIISVYTTDKYSKALGSTVKPTRATVSGLSQS